MEILTTTAKIEARRSFSPIPMPKESIPLADYSRPTEEALRKRLAQLIEQTKTRRTVRHFSDQKVPRDVIESCLRIAGSAPSGANQQPWHFAAVRDPSIKSRIRQAAEAEERAFYDARAPQEWLNALEPLGTDADKPFLEIAPWLIVIFTQPHQVDEDGTTQKHYYPLESVGIATGMLIQAIHLAGLASLTHTPSPMKFLNEILDRPKHEKPFLLLVVGYPADDARVPQIEKKALDEISSFH